MSAQKKTLQSFLDCLGCFQERLFLGTFGWHGICRVDQAGIETMFSLPPEVLSLQVCATTPRLLQISGRETLCFLCSSCFWSPSVVLAGLSSQRSACLWLPSAGIISMLHQGWLVQLLLCSPVLSNRNNTNHNYKSHIS